VQYPQEKYLGLHALISWNKRINIVDQDPMQWGAQISTIGQSNNAFGDFINGDGVNINYDLGFSIEKKFENRGRVALDVSYGFATGVLEAGTYSVTRSAVSEPIGSYSINGAGPKVKFRYYLYSKGT